MTPDEILKRAESLGALSPESVAKIVIIILVIVLLLLAGAALYRSRGEGSKVESEASSLKVAINSLASSVDRQHAREDKADAIIASMAQLTGEAAQATQKTLAALLQGVETLTTKLGDFKDMSDGLSQNNTKLGELIETVQSQGQAIQTANQTVQEILAAVLEIKQLYSTEIAAMKQNVAALEQTVATQQETITRLQLNKETTHA